MKTTLRILAATLVLAAASGCVVSVNDGDGRADWQEAEERNRTNIDRLELGMSAQRVRDIMGTPTFSEAFEVAGDSYRTLFYRTHRVHGDSRTTRDETTPVILRNGQLWGWGASAWMDLTGRPLGEEPVADSRY